MSSVDTPPTQTALRPDTILAPALASRHARVRGFLHHLAERPPQVLLLEGGTADERAAMALYWAALLNCTEQERPCRACPACVQMTSLHHRDMFFLDGREGAIKIQDIREVRSVLGEPPRGGGRRMVILAEAQALGIEAANALLKSLEEPRPGTSFVLLAPQRERLLPTLISRSWVLTLAWPGTDTASDSVEDAEQDLAPWAEALAEFARTGTGWFGLSSAKGGLDNLLAQRIVVLCQRELAAAMRGGSTSSPLCAVLAGLGQLGQRRLDEALAECQESLIAQVNPALVMDWLATRLALLRAVHPA